MRYRIAPLILAVLISDALPAQATIAERVGAAGTRTVALTTRARSEVCGDGVDVVSDGLGGAMQFYSEYYDGSEWTRRPCVHGPLRLTLRMVDGVPSRLRATAGALPTLGDTVLDLGTVGAAAAGEYLRDLVRHDDGRVGMQALLPLILVDSTPRWDILAIAARDSTRTRRYRQRASELLARGAAGMLGAAGWSDDAAAEQRRAVVSALANRAIRGSDPVPDLLEIARSNPHPDARAAAIHQLGQTADMRAISLFASLLGLSTP